MTCLQAVIGAGPAGLEVAWELLKEGHIVTIFEAGPGVGGAWRFDNSVDSDPLGLDPDRQRVHSSMWVAWWRGGSTGAVLHHTTLP